MKSITEERVKFSDVDSMGIMWHGHYIKLFEEGRERFGIEHGLDYLQVHRLGYFTPIVNCECKHFSPLQYGDTAIIETTYEFTKAAKLIFSFKVYSKNQDKLACTGKTVQVFLDKERNLQITNPAFYLTWKKQNFPNE
jgi:acyl-CoA thioester hydrolase